MNIHEDAAHCGRAEAAIASIREELALLMRHGTLDRIELNNSDVVLVMEHLRRMSVLLAETETRLTDATADFMEKFAALQTRTDAELANSRARERGALEMAEESERAKIRASKHSYDMLQRFIAEAAKRNTHIRRLQRELRQARAT
jgi:phage regulator Rha-like protein